MVRKVPALQRHRRSRARRRGGREPHRLRPRRHQDEPVRSGDAGSCRTHPPRVQGRVDMTTKTNPLTVMEEDLHFVRTVRNDPEANEASYNALAAVAELLKVAERIRTVGYYSTTREQLNAALAAFEEK